MRVYPYVYHIPRRLDTGNPFSTEYIRNFLGGTVGGWQTSFEANHFLMTKTNLHSDLASDRSELAVSCKLQFYDILWETGWKNNILPNSPMSNLTPSCPDQEGSQPDMLIGEYTCYDKEEFVTLLFNADKSVYTRSDLTCWLSSNEAVREAIKIVKRRR